MSKSQSKMSSITGVTRQSKRNISSSKRSVISTTDGFKEMLCAACGDINITCPMIKCLIFEPLPWIIQESSYTEVTPKQSSFLSGKRLSKQATISEIAQTDKDVVIEPSEEIRVIYPNRTTPNSLICKQFKMTDGIIGALQKTLPGFNTFRVLKLEFCQLTLSQLKGVKFMLLKNPNIIDVSLDGNYIPKHPQYILLKNTKIRHLSLRFCKITDKGTKRFIKPYECTTPRTLLTLNLASNLITDAGAKSLADELRSNRTLTHLNLSDNLITDAGAIELLKILRRFPLRHDEIVHRRQKNLHRLLLKEEIRYDITRSKKSESTISLVKSDLISKRSCSSARIRTAYGNQRRRHSADSQRSIESLIESKLPKDPYPFVYECTAENKEVYCCGNSNLQYLNLSYNKITDVGLDFVKDTLREMQLQRVFDDRDRILKIVLEGNNIQHPDLISTSSTYTGSSESKASSRSSVRERRLFASKIII